MGRGSRSGHKVDDRGTGIEEALPSSHPLACSRRGAGSVRHPQALGETLPLMPTVPSTDLKHLGKITTCPVCYFTSSIVGEACQRPRCPTNDHHRFAVPSNLAVAVSNWPASERLVLLGEIGVELRRAPELLGAVWCTERVHAYMAAHGNPPKNERIRGYPKP